MHVELVQPGLRLSGAKGDYHLPFANLVALGMECVRAGGKAGTAATARAEEASAPTTATVVAAASSTAGAVPVAARAALTEASVAPVAVASGTAGSAHCLRAAAAGDRATSRGAPGSAGRAAAVPA